MLLILAMIGFMGFVQAQDVPAKAKTDFQTRFPNASAAKWEKEAKGFEVNFKEGEKKGSAEYSAKGDWLTTEYKISKSEVPANVSSAVLTKFPGAEIVAAESVQTSKAGMQYEVVVKHHGKFTELLTDASGKVLKSEAKGENGSEGTNMGSGSEEDGSGSGSGSAGSGSGSDEKGGHGKH